MIITVVMENGTESCIFYNSSTDLFAFGDYTDPSLNMNFGCQDSDCMYETNLASIMSLRESEMTLTMSDSFNNLTYWIGLFNFDVLNDESFEYRWTNFGKENSASN